MNCGASSPCAFQRFVALVSSLLNRDAHASGSRPRFGHSAKQPKKNHDPLSESQFSCFFRLGRLSRTDGFSGAVWSCTCRKTCLSRVHVLVLFVWIVYDGWFGGAKWKPMCLMGMGLTQNGAKLSFWMLYDLIPPLFFSFLISCHGSTDLLGTAICICFWARATVTAVSCLLTLPVPNPDETGRRHAIYLKARKIHQPCGQYYDCPSHRLCEILHPGVRCTLHVDFNTLYIIQYIYLSLTQITTCQTITVRPLNLRVW